MYMKKLIVDDIQTGWTKIYEELGENAIIISIKEINNQFEIIAASPVETKTSKSDITFVQKINEEFSTEKDTTGLENVFNILFKAKKSKNYKKELLSNMVHTYFNSYFEIENKRELIEQKISSKKLEKKYINILGGVATGKTTTIAKLAAILKFSKNRKIAIASFDFFKIGGFENLKKFAEIMQIPFFPIKGEKDLILYKDSLEDYQHIIFDTPGNIKNLEDIQSIVEYISKSPDAENILTISVDKKETIIKKEMEYFSKFNISNVILTKYDEVSKEEFFLTLSNIPYKVSYITNGLNVPNDIFEFENLLEKIEVL